MDFFLCVCGGGGGALSPLFLDLRLTPTLGKKNTHIGILGTAHHPRLPGLLVSRGVNGPTALDCRVGVNRVGILNHFSMATSSPPHRAPSSVWFYNHFSPLSVT